MSEVKLNWENISPQERRQRLADLAQQGLGIVAPKFRVKRFYLTTKTNRTHKSVSEHIFGSVIKSFWVCNWSGDFDAKLVPNFDSDKDLESGLPLRKNLNMALSIPAADACLEFDAQPGVWIEIAYSDLEDIDVKSVEASLTATSTDRDGNSFSQSKKTIGATAPFTVVCAASGSRGKATIRNNHATNYLYLGTEAELVAADWDAIALVVPPKAERIWKNSAELRGGYISGSGTCAVCEEEV